MDKERIDGIGWLAREHESEDHFLRGPLIDCVQASSPPSSSSSSTRVWALTFFR